MNHDERTTARIIIAAWFKKRDDALHSAHGTVVHDTTHGIWGSTGVDDAFLLCERLGLREGMRFCDLGSGDGRIAMIASLFCDSIGIEGDQALDHIAQQAKTELLRQIPQLERCELMHADYSTIDLSNFDILFSFADHAWPEHVERALVKREKAGTLVAHQDIFRPRLLRKGPTIWIGQTPFVTYPIGR